ncbi:MAG: N-acetylmuramoyl-L-alanine amidase [Oscillospiraceae bacterium]|nr:N-acetylmuramoyl-L-alanine amidase [Oscillospiraceae bacterium]
MKRHLFAYVTVVTAVLVAVVFCANLYTSAMAVAAAAEEPVTVVIDAGHGGEDGGAVSEDQTYESRLNLEIALRLNDLFHLLGQETKMIRTEDVSVYTGNAKTISEKKISDLKNRVSIVNETPNALLLSIHQNMFSQAKYYGTQVFYAPTDDSKQLAENLQAIFSSAVDTSNHRTAKSADAVYLMNHITCAGVLVECGFLSNPEECAKLCTEGYQKQLSIAIASGITDYIRKANTDEI